MKLSKITLFSLPVLVASWLLLHSSSCGSSVKNSSAFLVGGTVSGLNGTLVVQNAGQNLSLTSNGTFSFATSVEDGTAFDITVNTQPSLQTCSVANGKGAVTGADITNIAITCITTPVYSIGGTVSGLTGTVILQNNGGDSLAVAADGSFTFATQIADAAAYVVTVSEQPTNQTCTLAEASGAVSAAPITNVAVTCTTNAVATGATPTYTISGSISGLTGTLVAQNNGGNDLTVTSNGNFVFTTALANAAAYAVTISSQPSGQTCTLSNASGVVSSANITNVGISCAATTYTVGGTISGLTGTVVLQNNAGDNLSLTANGSFTFATTVALSGAYAVTVLTHPTGYRCTLTNASGTVSANVTNVTASCLVNKIIKVSSTVTDGLLGGSAGAAITAADAICGSGYKALIASTTRNTTTDWPLTANRTYVRDDGTTVISTTDANGLLTFPLTNSISTSSLSVWTGLFSSSATGTNCTNWTTNAGGTTARYGVSDVVNTNSISFTTTNCNNQRYLYCVEQ